MKPADFFRLTRISLAPTALADPIAGMMLATRGDWPDPILWLLIPVSLCFFHGGMVLNDWCDRTLDAIHRPLRPLPSGRVAPGEALALACGLFALGVGLAFLIDWRVGCCAGLLVGLIAAYDLGPRGPFLGPLLMGSCRGGNLALAYLAGMWALGAPTNLLIPEATPMRLVVPLAYGGYVFLLSRFARAEDGEAELDSRSLRAGLLCTMTLLPLPALLAGLALHSPVGGSLGALLAASGAPGILAAARGTEDWTRKRVTHCVGLLLRRLLLVSASIALVTALLGSAGLWGACLILAGYPLAKGLRGIAPPS